MPGTPSIRRTQLFIDGHWGDAASGASFAVVDPATGETLARVADGGKVDAVRAIEAAGRAQNQWAGTAPRERGEILRRAFELLHERKAEIASVMTAEMGKPLTESAGEVDYGAEFFRWFSEEAVRIHGDWHNSPDGGKHVLVRRQPVGPCVLVTPWNFPLAMATRKIGPAIAAGCTMVLKPASATPLTSLLCAEVLHDAGLPAGVLSVVPSSTAGEIVTAWMESPISRKVSFTGSTDVGKTLLEQAAKSVMKTSMELGGNAPFIIREDANITEAVEALSAAKLRNIGQACISANRIFVHRSIADEIGAALTEKFSGLKIGPGSEDSTSIGPLINQEAIDTISALVKDATARGATVTVGGRPVAGPGFFFEPTVITGVHPDSDLMQSEIFGPVAALIPFDSDDEALAMSNDTEWGLAGYLCTQSLAAALDYAERLEVGMLGINTGGISTPAAPFGGIKESGVGREGADLGIEEFLEVKYIAIPR